MVRRLLLVVLFSSLACRSAPPDGPKPRPLTVLSVEEARAAASSATNVRQTVDLAWLYGNDRDTARKALDAALLKTPYKAALLLRRARLAQLELDDDGALERYLKIIEHAPETPEAEFALVFAQEFRDDGFGERRREAISKAVLASGMLQRGDSPRVRTRAAELLVALAHEGDDLELLKERVAQGGFITNWRTLGPMAPFDDASFTRANPYEANARWDRRLIYQGQPVRVLQRQSPVHRFLASPGEHPGLFVHDTWVLLDEVPAVHLVAELESSTRIALDGQVLVERDESHHTPARWAQVTFRTTPGWHRLTFTALAPTGTNPFVALVDSNGNPAATKVDSTPRLGNPKKEAFAIARVSYGPNTTEGWIARTLNDPDLALWGRLVASQFLSMGLGDRDRAIEIFGATAEHLPNSAVVQLGRASLAHRRSGVREAALEAALTADPTLPAALFYRVSQLSDDEPDQALQLYAQLEAVASKQALTRILGHRLYAQRGWIGSAAKHIDSKGWRPGHRLAVAQWLLGQDWVDQAKAVWDELFADSGTIKRQHMPGLALRRAQPEKAVEMLKQTVDWGDPATVWTHIGEIELGRGAFDKAHAALAFAKKSDPEHLGSRRLRLKLAEAQDDNATFFRLVEEFRQEGLATLDLEVRAADRKGHPLGQPRSKWLQDKLRYDVAKAVQIPDRWPEERKVLLLERTVDYVFAGGESLSIEHRIQRLKTKEATDEAGELRIPPEALVMAVRTHKTDGRIIEADRHAGKEDLSYSAIAPGDSVEEKLMYQRGAATPWGGFLRTFHFQGSAPAVRAELVIVVPKNMNVTTHSYHGAPEATVHEEGTERIYTFTASDVDALATEPFGSSAKEYVPLVVFVAGLDAKAARASNMLAVQRRGRLGPTVRAKAGELLRAGPPEELARRIFDFVYDDIDDGSETDPEVQLQTKRGRRLDMYAALARACGLKFEWARLRTDDAAQLSPEIPQPDDFSAMALRISEDNNIRWVQFGQRDGTFDKLSPPFLGGSYLVSRDGRALVRTIPEAEVNRWALTSAVDLNIDAEGTAVGTLAITLPGSFGQALRQAVIQSRLAGSEAQLHAAFARLIPGARVTSLDTENLEDRAKPFTVRVFIEAPAFMVIQGKELVAERFMPQLLTHQLLDLPGFAAYLMVPERKTPLKLRPTSELMVVRLAVTSASGAPRVAPRSFERSNEWFSARQEVVWKDDTLFLERKVAFEPHRVPVKEFKEFSRRVESVTAELGGRLVVPRK